MSYVAERRRWIGSVRRVLAARAIQGSNSIEGFCVTVEDAVAALEGEEPADADIQDWQAVTGYRRAMTFVLQLASDDHFAYTSDLLRSLHFMMTEYSLDAWPGRWRPGGIWVRDESTSEVVYEAPDADDVPKLIDELIEQLASNGDVNPMVRGALAHLNLVMIHPFKDGNGRMARALQTLVLAREGIQAQEFCSIEEFLGRNTEHYYRVLADVGHGEWNPQNDARDWVRFCLIGHYFQASSVLRLCGSQSECGTRLKGSLSGTVSRIAQLMPFSMLYSDCESATRVTERRSGVGTSKSPTRPPPLIWVRW